MAPSVLGILTGSTCGDACWHAREEVCHCSCGGANHGILRDAAGVQPVRTRRVDGLLFELVGVLALSPEDSCFAETLKRWARAFHEVVEDRFPGLDLWAYGAWRQEKTPPVLDLKLTAVQARWPEVVAVPGARRLLWARPRGTSYQQRRAAREVAV